jgi:two-component system sensor histidine kinase ChvG
MRIRIGRRLALRFLVVHLLIVGVPLAGVSFARFYEREMLRGLEADMIHQAEILRLALIGADPPARARLIGAAGRGTLARVRVYDAGGVLVADSQAATPDPAPAGGPGPPREVAAALAGRYGSATRLSSDGGRLYLSSALPLVAGGAVTGAVRVTRSTDPVRAAMYRLRATLFRVLVVALLATTVVSLFLAATVSRPLALLARRARRLAAGDPGGPPPLADRRDEIGALARDVEAMARRLDERARAAARLAADVSHEFKSPLTSLRGAAELLLDGADEDPATRRKFLANMRDDAVRLDRLLTRLLELARHEEGGAMATVDLVALVQGAARGRAGAAPVALELPATPLPARVRPAHLASAVVNLVDNAQRHAAPGTAVTVRLERAARRARVTVHNHGAPIRPHDLPRVFDRFFTTRAAEGGTGLGLAIVKAVAEGHGGAVTVRSAVPDGTTFALELDVE